MPVKNGGGGESDGDVSGGAESEHSNSSQGHESSDEEANEIDSDDSSEMDVNEIERRRTECLEILDHLEKQFNQLREQYYTERINQIERQSAEVRNGRSEEYLQPLKELDKVYKNRIEVAEILRRYRLENIEHKFLSEEQAALQNFESEKQLALDQIYDDLMEKIRRLEEDRHNVDISWDDWGNDKRHSKVRGPARKKAVTVTGPFIVYMLHEEDILEDWTTIRKALKRSTLPGPVSAASAT
ncbi:breast cancer metastasis-suppressor 1-like protein [Musca vetustissima]|uniref:breast cancer metastasis-suppressor 1-like protein n=1 Tax=Musca vetustissima TaxID=27455 RepID=UPI002AB6FAFD|nr:breast cancer metastasis-suppressor 1-like protein [Musca vetustissima]